MTKHKIIAKDKQHLEELIKNEIKLHGVKCDLNHIDVSNITNLSGIFTAFKFNGDISNWNISNVINMANIFYDSQLEKDKNTPYWNIEDKEIRDKEVKIYQVKLNLHNKLNDNLSSKNISQKPKI